jgi:hypothetical protein
MGPPCRGQTVRYYGRFLVLPDMHRRPAERSEDLVVSMVTFAVRVEFGGPPLRVRLGGHPVIRAGVPEAAIDEHRHPEPHEHHIRPAREVPTMQSEPNPSCMQLPTQGKLRRCVLPADGPHELSHRRRRRRRPVNHPNPLVECL